MAWPGSGTRTTGRLLTALEHPAPLVTAAFSPDGRRIVTATGDPDEKLGFGSASAHGEARVWDAETGQSLAALDMAVAS